MTARFFDGFATIRAIPLLTEEKSSSLSIVKFIKSIFTPKSISDNATAILDTVNARNGFGGREVFVSHNFKSKLTREEFETLAQKFDWKSLQVTHFYKFRTFPCIVIILQNWFPIIFNCERVGDYHLPTFDVDDGFRSNAFDSQENLEILKEMNESFILWKQNLDATKFESWNQDILLVEK